MSNLYHLSFEPIKEICRREKLIIFNCVNFILSLSLLLDENEKIIRRWCKIDEFKICNDSAKRWDMVDS